MGLTYKVLLTPVRPGLKLLDTAYAALTAAAERLPRQRALQGALRTRVTSGWQSIVASERSGESFATLSLSEFTEAVARQHDATVLGVGVYDSDDVEILVFEGGSWR